MSVDVADDLVVTTDRAALEIVVNNLIDNAAKYSGRPARVTVVARRDSEKRVRFEVSDNGIGIDRKNLKRVFHRFYRVEDEEVRQRRGTGLGLSTVYGIVKQSGGYVWADSEPGEGTAIDIFLPPVEAKLEETRADTSTALQVQRDTTILLTEDNQSVRELSGQAYAVLGRYDAVVVSGDDQDWQV